MKPAMNQITRFVSSQTAGASGRRWARRTVINTQLRAENENPKSSGGKIQLFIHLIPCLSKRRKEALNVAKKNLNSNQGKPSKHGFTLL